MHPILAHRGRLALYLIAWLALGLLMTLLTVTSGNMDWPRALIFSLPLPLFFAFVDLSAYHPWTVLGSVWYRFLSQITYQLSSCNSIVSTVTLARPLL
jgi:hypothetical protein